MQINCLPIPRDDETLYSITARTRLLNAARHDRDACRTLFGDYPNMRVSDFPVNLTHFCASTRGQFGSPDHILNGMTLVRFFEKIGRCPWHTGSRHSPVSTAGYGLATLSNGSAGKWHACPKCIEQDLAITGIAYWRRSHHLPTGFICPIHNAPLAACKFRGHEHHNHFLLPEQTILDVDFWNVDWNSKFDILARLTKLSVSILQDINNPHTAKIMRTTLISALRDQGFIMHSGKIRGSFFISEFTHRYGFLSNHPDLHEAVSSKGIVILQRNLMHSEKTLSTTHNLLLIDWLFGTWDAFTSHCLWQSFMDNPDADTDFCKNIKSNGVQNDLLKASLADITTPVHEHRRVCLDFLKTSSLTSRSYFARSKPKSFRWLMRNDLDWLNSSCPVEYLAKKQSELF